MPGGRPPELDGVAFPAGTEAPAVEHDQDDRGARPMPLCHIEGMQSSRALRALPVVLGLVAPLSLAAQARYRVTTDGAWFYQEPGGKRLARLARGAVLIGGEAQGDWQGVILEGWIFTTSVGPTPRAGYDLAVTRAPEEDLRSAPAGALLGKLPQGFLLNRVAEGSSGRWIHVTSAGWVDKSDVESV